MYNRSDLLATLEKYIKYPWMNFKVPGHTQGWGKPMRRYLDMYEGGAYYRWSDPSFQSHLCIERHPVLPKQLSQLCFHWLRDRKYLRDISIAKTVVATVFSLVERQERLERPLGVNPS